MALSVRRRAVFRWCLGVTLTSHEQIRYFTPSSCYLVGKVSLLVEDGFGLIKYPRLMGLNKTALFLTLPMMQLDSQCLNHSNKCGVGNYGYSWTSVRRVSPTDCSHLRSKTLDSQIS